MVDVRNLDNKLVCCIDEAKAIVEIRLKDCKTNIRLLQSGKLEIKNTKVNEK